MTRSDIWRTIALALSSGLCTALNGCGGINAENPDAAVAVPTVAPSPTPNASRLYVEYGTPGAPLADGVAIYALPLVQGSLPVTTISGRFGSLAFDPSGNMFVSATNEIDEYTAPLRATSTASAIISTGPASIPTSAHDIQFDPFGNLWAETDYDLREFSAPVSPGSIASTIVTGGGNAALSFDWTKGTLYAGPMSPPFGQVPVLQIYGQFPYTAPPKRLSVPFGIPIGFDGNGNAIVYSNGFAVNATPQPPGFGLVPTSFGNASLPVFDVAFSLYNGQSSAHTAALDSSGTLYAIDANASNAVTVFNGPLSATSTAAFAISGISTGGGLRTPVAVYTGP